MTRRLPALAVACLMSFINASGAPPPLARAPAFADSLSSRGLRAVLAVRQTGTGTARISGIVVGTETPPQPVRRVIVTLTGAELPGGRTAISDDSGRFAFERLPAGRFTLSGTKPGFLPADYGSPKPGRPGIPLQVTASQQMAAIVLTMAHAAAISGTLRDPGGEPVENMPVHAFRMPKPGAAPILTLTASAVTDDRGVYRVYGLTPGDYLVATAVRVGGVGSGDVMAMSAAQIDEALRELRAGTPGLSAEARSAKADTPGLAPSVAYAPVFYPGTSSPSSATTITVGVGVERGDVDFTVQFTRMATIEGSLRAADGTVPATVFVINADGLQMRSLISSVPTFSSQTGPSGKTFKYTNVAPGRYRIMARSASPVIMWAKADVEVTGDDVSGLALVLQPGLRLSGRIVFDGAALKPPDPTAVSLRLAPTNDLGSSSAGTTNMGNFPIPPAVIGAGGTFEITGIVPDTYRIATTVPGAAGWWLRSAIVNGRDVLDSPLEFAAGDISGAVLTFSDRHTALSGRLETAAGQPASAYFVAVFPADRALWRPLSRRIQLVRADAGGTWIAKDLPPGDYRIAALTEVDSADLLDARVLDSLTAFSVPVTLADGEQKTQNLRLGGS